MNCTLCGAETKAFWKSKRREFVACTKCGGIQLLPEFYVTNDSEKDRYLTHNNDIKDPRYQEFVSPITSRISNDFSITNSGLDYGCGTGPVAATELEKQGYSVALYDPYFYPDKRILKNSYDFIICCEVMEHFHDPAGEFRELSDKLNPGGKLYCKTSLYTEGLDFDNWYYKNDPTHVFFYTEKSLIWIKDNFGFSKVEIAPKLIVFSK